MYLQPDTVLLQVLPAAFWLCCKIDLESCVQSGQILLPS